MKSFFRSILDFFFKKLLPSLLHFYEIHFLYRMRQSWGVAILHRVKNKGENVRIHGHGVLIKPEYLTIKDNVRIGTNCYFFCIGGIQIGFNTQISRNVTIYASNHNFDSTAIPYDISYMSKPVKIGNSVLIGMGACILPGVTIGDGAIIGMGAIITKDIPDGAIVVGAKQRIVKYRNMEKFRQLEKDKKWFGALYPNS